MPDCPADWQPTPDAVAAAQRADVAAAVADLGPAASVLAVAERIRLHPWVVVRRLKELGASVPGMDWAPARKERSEKQNTANFLGRNAKGAA